MVIDLLLTAWMTGVSGLLLLVAAPRIFALRDPDRLVRLVEAAGLLTLVTVLAVSTLADGRLLNWFTLVLVCAAAPLTRWLRAHGWSTERAVRETARRAAIQSARMFESESVASRLVDLSRSPGRAIRQRARRAMGRLGDPSLQSLLVVAVASGAAAVTVYLRYAPVLGDLRLGSPDAYGVLLQARQALHNQPPQLLTPVTAALAAALSLATSLNPLHVVRLMGPAIGVATVCAAAVLTYRLTRSVPAAAGVLWILGGCTFALTSATPAEIGPAWIFDRTLARQWTANDGTTALLFLLLGGIGLASWRRRRPALASGTAACLGVTALASPALLLLAIPAGVAWRTPPAFRYFTLSAIWTAISLSAARAGASDLAFTLPVAVAFLAIAACTLVAHYLGRVVRANLQPAAVGILVVLTLALIPQRAGALYLEHEITAFKTLEIASTFPRGRWMIVAPVEQLAQTYGRGWFEDPAAFVARNAGRAGDPAFAFDLAVDDLFVFVERRPFKTFRSEAADVPFATLRDPSYKHYRSLAGRASLQAQLDVLCKAYARSHANVSIYYEDANITIYRFGVSR
jgi:hypothetical protein